MKTSIFAKELPSVTDFKLDELNVVDSGSSKSRKVLNH